MPVKAIKVANFIKTPHGNTPFQEWVKSLLLPPPVKTASPSDLNPSLSLQSYIDRYFLGQRNKKTEIAYKKALEKDKDLFYLPRKISLLKSCSSPQEFPPCEVSEVAFLGRSNVDMPGYGFALAEEGVKNKWPELIMSYCQRKSLRKLFLLVDARHGLKYQDHIFFNLLDYHKVYFQVILTKCDLVHPFDLACVAESVYQDLSLYRKCDSKVLFASVFNEFSLDKLRKELLLERIFNRSRSKERAERGNQKHEKRKRSEKH
ncbi:hypothetical protein O9G_001941 [Rozella allomycis CSF55]|uniref:P-loop containing nucleoside triphosphate hydrolase domain-containing protein n=1 Tax=Rozella allomycis (strain CSF55) TaxID=988480 RepID=A0A075APD4_ROZAC|nr:hypothetical protein O9G_001941 [Rozella allomycis CSF55]|eukprot:EPZ31931.1 hypothetical protein O9G_001941 [Rozella allomycis CSF55]